MTRVVVTTESRFTRTPDGTVWTGDVADHRFWRRYTAVFASVRVVARVADVPRPGPADRPVTGDGVEVWPVPSYAGPAQYLRARERVRRTVLAAAGDADAVILRVPSPIGMTLALARNRRGLPFGLEVVGDPHDALAPGAVRHPLRPVLRHWMSRQLRRQCASAAALSYVTERSLQSRYPARPGAYTTACSSIDLPEEAYAPAPRPAPQRSRLVSVGSLAQPYKGIDTLIGAVARLAGAGHDVTLTHLGEGRLRGDLAELAGRLGVADRVTFAGLVSSGPEVWRRLDEADLFVLPSRAEGLPRALIEAMARGLPAIGARVGGVPELLPPEDLVAPGDPARLAEAVGAMLADRERMAIASARNLARARDYAAARLTPRRIAFYEQVRELAERRAARRPAGPPAPGAQRATTSGPPAPTRTTPGTPAEATTHRRKAVE
ncbi:glycosyltransferase [Micromonospora sp. URMC 105]|uniref:glycosyltransferase n=1 Tax=Micromonospora sp. URMC 105 TaxID=3423413 RepID=UPI003F1A921F